MCTCYPIINRVSELKVHIELTRFVQPEKIEIDANERAVNEKSQYCFFVCTTFDSFLNDLFPSLYVWSGVWQGIGFGAIIYMAALAGVDQEQHEAAIIDGATLLQRIWYVDVPAIIPTAVIMLILNMGGTLNIGYEKILAMQNQNNVAMSEVISTYSYKVSLVSSFPDFSYSTAIGLFQSLVGLVLIIITNKIANKLSGTGFM